MRERLRLVKSSQPKNIIRAQVERSLKKLEKMRPPVYVSSNALKIKKSKIQPCASETWTSDCRLICILPLGEFSFCKLQESLLRIILKKT